MNAKTLSAFVSALVLVPSVAWAQPAPLSQDLTITTLGASGFSGRATAERKVIKNAADYAAWFGGTAPSAPTVDFASEDVLAVAMGQCPSTGYAIQIARVEYMTGGFTGGMAFVHVKETRPAPGSIGGAVVMTPTHVVKVAKKATTYVFVTDPPPSSFDKVSSTVAWAFDGTSTQVEVDAAGNATLYRSSPTARYAPIPGVATAAELKAVKDTFTNADPKTLPAEVKDDRVFIVAPKTITLVSTIAGVDYTFAASLDYYKTYQSRVKPLADALQAIADRLIKSPPFDKLALTTEGGGFIAHRDDYYVSYDGTVTVLDRVGMGPTRPFTGRATQAELDAIKAAFTAADVTTLPAKLQPTSVVPNLPDTRLVSTVYGKDYDTLMVAGGYGLLQARLQPLVLAIKTCGDRVLKDALPQSIQGVVTYSVGVLKVGTYTVPTNDTLRATIYSLRGQKITIHVTGATGVEWIDATTTTTCSLRKLAAYWGQTIEVLPKAAQVQITARSAAGDYYKVTAPDGQVGWVYRYYVNAAN